MGQKRQQGKRQQGNRGPANRGGGSRGPVSRGTTPNRGGDSLPTSGVSVYDSQGADDYIAEMRTERGIDVTKPRLSPQSSQAADDVLADLAQGNLSAQDIADMPDEGRLSIPLNMLPKAPRGKKWAEDRTLVDKEF